MCILFGLRTINLFSSTILQPATLRLYAVSSADALPQDYITTSESWVLMILLPLHQVPFLGLIFVGTAYGWTRCPNQSVSLSEFWLGRWPETVPVPQFLLQKCWPVAMLQDIVLRFTTWHSGQDARHWHTSPQWSEFYIPWKDIFTRCRSGSVKSPHMRTADCEYTSSLAHFHLFSNFQVGLCFEANCTSWMTP